MNFQYIHFFYFLVDEFLIIKCSFFMLTITVAEIVVFQHPALILENVYCIKLQRNLSNIIVLETQMLFTFNLTQS